MSLLVQITHAWQALLHTVSYLRRGSLWVPLLLLGALQLAAVGLLWGFAHPAVSWFMAPLLARIAGAEVLRYPNVFRVMPGLYAQIGVLLGAVVGSIVIGAATVLFAAHARGRSARISEALGSAWRKGLTLIAVNLPFNVLVVALSYGLEWWISRRGSGVMVQRAAYVTVLAGSVVLQSMFFYVSAVVMLEGRGVVGTVAALTRSWARGFWAAMLVGVLLVIPLLPIHFLSGRSSMLVDRGSPELVGWMVLTQWALELVLWFLLAGTSTVLYLSLVAESADGDAS